jgi:hypothetical protein
MKKTMLLIALLFFCLNTVAFFDDQSIYIFPKQDKNVDDINVLLRCTGTLGLAANGACYSFGGSGDYNVSWVDLNAVFYKQLDLNRLLQVSDFNRVYYSQKDLNNNNLFIKVSDSNNVGRLNYSVIANPPWATNSDLNANFVPYIEQ